MSGDQEDLEIKFRLYDGSDIGPKKYPIATSVASVKQSIFADWPKVMPGKVNAPRTVNDLKLINAGMILENHKTLQEYKNPLVDISEGATTMHVVVRPPLERGAEKKSSKKKKEPKCNCVIM